MSLETVRKCDAFGVFKGVERYHVKVVKMDGAETELSDVLVALVDLSPRGLNRLVKFIGHGITATKRRAEEGGSD